MYRNSLLERMYSSVDPERGTGASSSGQRRILGASTSQCAVLIGHRGLKMNHQPDEAIRENTVRSLIECHRAGATYAEFDIQVTADGVPVLWHDDQVVTTNGDREVFHEVSELSLQAFRTLTSGCPVEFEGRVHQLVRNPRFECQKNTQSTRPLPWTCKGDASGMSATLQEAFEQAPPELGFNIELKFDSKRVSSAVERAFHLSSTLRVVKAYASGRPMLFSSFDVDACLEVRGLQEEHPVFMLTCMEKEHPDPRRRSLHAAVVVALAFGLDGIVADNSHLFKELAQVERLRNAGLPLFSYGPANCNSVLVSMQIAAGVSGIITDDIGICVNTISILDGFTTQEARKIESSEPVEEWTEYPAVTHVDMRPVLVATA
mmetsp:Transcript_817/g.1713  ORF Transcript_817/g.1713 Transcript_817/m.1713 type:complete len:376 (-) Transcript_817:83-1210(-)|eukprot:CAMPEP_0118932922 /NCGR_PEP_ID=MMETSP1169-20130426/10690_1 /TAXON_ID=36882 /ORGANISM="Pyramimonas obovata, Strain CCMP722" /LENGTH=375 /DNA_ID=CAMNT_0006875627 /DNA_START=98 /DNA_END=1225 /DNA_ORIENTATION=+